MRFPTLRACVILANMNEFKPRDYADWVETAKANGWGDLLAVLLDALAPLGVLGAQVLYVGQPVLSVFVNRDALTALAGALEDPDELDALRRQLEDVD